MKLFTALFAATLILSGCAASISTYEYTHLSDGSTAVKVRSANEIGNMQMGINRETGTLEVTIGDMTKKTDTAEVVAGIKEIVHDVASVAAPVKQQ